VDAWTRLLRAAASARRCLRARLDGEHELSVNDFEALSELAHAEEGALRRVDLAEALQLSPSGVTRLLEGLERARLVEKASCPNDARVTYAVLTEAGRARLEQASCSHVRAIEALFEERYSRDELRTLVELLGRLPAAE
jgi:DNA-binding MarR family transcriptional regulator